MTRLPVNRSVYPSVTVCTAVTFAPTPPSDIVKSVIRLREMCGLEWFDRVTEVVHQINIGVKCLVLNSEIFQSDFGSTLGSQTAKGWL